MTDIHIQPLTAEAFAPFGDVLEVSGDPDVIINDGRCGRFHDRAKLDFSDGRAAISLFASTPVTLPYTCNLLERHPLGSQAFIPMTPDPFLVIVALDDNGKPHDPKAFLTQSGQAVNYFRNTWHGVLTPLVSGQTFMVIDRVGEGNNLQEYRVDEGFTILLG
ncbi:ureidoglycolate lyase [Halovulum sp. GXIMD14793]